jgi:hypothetical protein
MKNNYLFIIILALVIANIYFLFTSSLKAGSAEDPEKVNEIEQNIKKSFDRHLSNILHWNYKMNGLRVNENFRARDRRNNPVSFRELLKDHAVVIADFRFATCQMCVNSETALLEKLSTRAGPESVFILDHFGNTREQKAFEEQFNVRTLSTGDGSNPLLLSSSLQSCIFVVDTSGRVRDYFIPTRDTQAFHPEYYDIILEKYF